MTFDTVTYRDTGYRDIASWRQSLVYSYESCSVIRNNGCVIGELDPGSAPDFEAKKTLWDA